MPAENVTAVLPLFNASLTHAVYLFMPHLEESHRVHRDLVANVDNTCFVDEDRIIALCHKIGCRFWQIPTSGMVAIDSFVASYGKVSLHGFNFFQGRKMHYFDETPMQLILSWLERTFTHDPACEKRYVERLIADGKASFVNPDDSPVPSPKLSRGDFGWLMTAWLWICRWSYFTNLGTKIPAGLVVRASRALHVLAFLVLCWTPFLIYCHMSLIPSLHKSPNGVMVWHALILLWITLPLIIVGHALLPAFPPSSFNVFLFVLFAVAFFHLFLVSIIHPTWLGTALFQMLLFLFEDLPAGAWMWCLLHVVRLQRHTCQQHQRASPLSGDDDVVIIGNAPTLTSGTALGPQIDRFPTVVRFNEFTVDPVEFSGSKTSFHFCSGRTLPSAKTSVLPHFNASLAHAVQLFMPRIEDTWEIYTRLTSTDVWFIDESRILSLHQKIGCRFWQVPSSGMLAIDAFRDRDVRLHGFNFFQSRRMHYFAETPLEQLLSWMESSLHSPREKNYVERLLKHGHVAFLSPPDDTDSESECEKKGGVRQRLPRLVNILLKDGLPSQFSV
uniref:Uncharacterized protein n=1 Tax=Noctiluca scintillans TaxID=2966 RepID=A0A7S1EXX7_NOCSC